MPVAVAAYDVFFVPPHFTFAVYDVQSLMTFAVMFTLGTAMGSLVARLRHAETASRQRERRCGDPGAQPAERGDHDREQVQHRVVGQRQPVARCHAERGGARDRDRAGYEAGEPQARRAGRCAGRDIAAGRDHVDLDVAGAADQIVEQAAAQPVAPPAMGRLAGEDPGDPALARHRQHRLGDRAPRQPRDLAAERLGERQVRLDAIAVLGRQRRRAGDVDVHGVPRCLHPAGEPVRGVDQPLRGGAGADADQHALGARGIGGAGHGARLPPARRFHHAAGCDDPRAG